MTTIARPGVREPLPGRPAALVARLAGIGTDEATWIAVATLGILALAAVLYIVNLTVSGYANTYYSAAAVAGSQSWSAWFFGSIDAGNFITVDKPPLGTMLLGLSVRIFGLSSWSILLPQALAGVATVGLLMAAVRRSFGSVEAIVAGLVAALTPAAVLIFRYDNPDALLTLLLVGAAYALVRALEAGRLRWLVVAASLVGLGFLTKYLQAYLVLPAFALTWAIAGPGSVRRRIAGLVVALATVIVASGWWVAIVELIPAASRPYIGGSQTNSVVDLLLGYDGLGRIFGQGAGVLGGGGGGGGGFSGVPGILRLFNAEFGGQIGWLVPLAVGATALGLWVRRHAPRTDARRAGYLLWGGWLAVHVIVFSFMSGIIHSYYAVVLAPAVGALVGAGAVEASRLRSRTAWGGVLMAAGIVGSAALAWALLERTPDFAPCLGIAIVALAILAAVLLAMPAGVISRRSRALAAGLAMAVLLAGPSAYAIDTIGTAYSGGTVSAGPTAVGARGGPGFVGGGPLGLAGPPPGGGFGGGGVFGDGFPGGGFPSGGAQADAVLTRFLAANRGGATWIAAVDGADRAASIEVATGLPVMAMGGFNGGDPAPTLDQLKADVASGRLRYVLLGGGRGPGGGDSSQIADWVAANGTVVSGVGNGSLYDLAGPA